MPRPMDPLRIPLPRRAEGGGAMMELRRHQPVPRPIQAAPDSDVFPPPAKCGGGDARSEAMPLSTAAVAAVEYPQREGAGIPRDAALRKRSREPPTPTPDAQPTLGAGEPRPPREGRPSAAATTPAPRRCPRRPQPSLPSSTPDEKATGPLETLPSGKDTGSQPTLGAGEPRPPREGRGGRPEAGGGEGEGDEGAGADAVRGEWRVDGIYGGGLVKEEQSAATCEVVVVRDENKSVRQTRDPNKTG